MMDNPDSTPKICQTTDKDGNPACNAPAVMKVSVDGGEPGYFCRKHAREVWFQACAFDWTYHEEPIEEQKP